MRRRISPSFLPKLGLAHPNSCRAESAYAACAVAAGPYPTAPVVINTRNVGVLSSPQKPPRHMRPTARSHTHRTVLAVCARHWRMRRLQHSEHCRKKDLVSYVGPAELRRVPERLFLVEYPRLRGPTKQRTGLKGLGYSASPRREAVTGFSLGTAAHSRHSSGAPGGSFRTV